MKLRLISGGLMLLVVSLSLAMPAEAQHPMPAQGHAAGAPVFRQNQNIAGPPQQQFQPRDFRQQNIAQPPVIARQPLQGFAAQQQQDYRRQQQLDRQPGAYRAPGVTGPVPFPIYRGRDNGVRFDNGQRIDPRVGDWRNDRGHVGVPSTAGPLGRPPYLNDRPDYRGRPGDFDGRGFVGRGNRDGRSGWLNSPAVQYRGQEPFRGRGFFDPYNHIRGGQGFYERNDARFYERQFGARWGNGWYGRTNGNWSNYRVRGRWPWYPAVGIGVGIGFYNGWGYNGIDIGFGNSGYYAVDGFCPTEYIYLVSTGQYWRPIAGGPGWYGSSLPDEYGAPITVAVSEVVPVTDDDGEVISYDKHVFYYNAFWDSSEGQYGYYDYNGDFHWVD